MYYSFFYTIYSFSLARSQIWLRGFLVLPDETQIQSSPEGTDNAPEVDKEWPYELTLAITTTMLTTIHKLTRTHGWITTLERDRSLMVFSVVISFHSFKRKKDQRSDKCYDSLVRLQYDHMRWNLTNFGVISVYFNCLYHKLKKTFLQFGRVNVRYASWWDGCTLHLFNKPPADVVKVKVLMAYLAAF